MIGVVAKHITGDIVTMNPPLALSTGGYLGEMLPIVKGGAKC